PVILTDSQRGPVVGTFVGAVAHTRLVVGEGIESHTVRAHQKIAEFIVASKHNRFGRYRIPHFATPLSGSIATLRVLCPIVQGPAIVSHLQAAIGAFNCAEFTGQMYA